MIASIFLRKIYSIYINRFIKNFFESDYNKKVLISYITKPFRNENKGHTNNFEVISAAKIFHELGYQVDVMYYEGTPPKLGGYDVIYGFGDVFQEYFESGLSGIKTIYYGAGMHVAHQNTATLNRIKDVYNKRHVWLAKSSRFVEKNWSHQTCLVDSIIALGDDSCKSTYEKYYDGIVYSLPAPFYKTLNAVDILKNRSTDAHKSFLWFGSSGLIHKGLDLCLDYFSTRPDLTLHICGDIFSEPDFVKVFDEELFSLSNIIVHGFVGVDSKEFKEILSSCSFVISPSCSEGGSPSVLTAIGNGALIPIITHESSVSTGNEIFIDSFDFSGIEKAVLQAELYSEYEIHELMTENLKVVMDNNSQDVYYSNLNKIISRIINHEM